MERLLGHPQDYDWGSSDAIADFIGQPATGEPLAELWFGAHPLASAHTEDGTDLQSLIAADPATILGPSTQYSFGDHLPYLMKLLAPTKPLSLQVHPDLAQAQAGFLGENSAGLAPGASTRVYRDPNHKPELLYALSDFEALVGFAVRRQVRELLDGLDASLAARLGRRLRLAAGRGMRPVVSWLLDPEVGPDALEIDEFAAACDARLRSGSSIFPLLDKIVGQLGRAYPGDPGVVVAFLMNPLHLHPGEAIYLPPRTLHSYQSGLGLEVMANSDNVIRAGLTSKHVDRELLIEITDFEAHPPTRIAPEHPSPQVNRFYAPVEDFELTVVTLDDETLPVTGSGPRIAICVDGNVTLMTRAGEVELARGECVLLSDAEGPALGSGTGTVAQCAVP